MTMKRRGVEMRMVVQAGAGREPDQALIDLIARSHIYLNRLTNGSASSIAELADQLGVHRADISRILPLAFLSPQLTESILSGRQPADLTVRTLSRLVDIPASWAEQATLLGGKKYHDTVLNDHPQSATSRRGLSPLRADVSRPPRPPGKISGRR